MSAFQQRHIDSGRCVGVSLEMNDVRNKCILDYIRGGISAIPVQRGVRFWPQAEKIRSEIF